MMLSQSLCLSALLLGGAADVWASKTYGTFEIGILNLHMPFGMDVTRELFQKLGMCKLCSRGVVPDATPVPCNTFDYESPA